MALPSIQPYAMPTMDEVPAARHPWVIDPSRAVLLVHDMQNYFLSAYTRGTEPVESLIGNIAPLRAACDRLGIPAIFTGKEHQTPRRRGLELDLWGPGMSADPIEAPPSPGSPHAAARS